MVTTHTPLPEEDGAGSYLFGILEHLAKSGSVIELLWLEPHDQIRWKGVWRTPGNLGRVCRLSTPRSWRLGPYLVFPETYWLPFKARMLHRIKHLLRRLGIGVGRRKSSGATTKEPSGIGQPRRAWMAPLTPEQLAQCRAAMRRFRPDVLVANYAWLCPVLDQAAARSIRKICLNHDVMSERSALLPNEGYSMTRAQEADYLQRADAIVAISERDGEAFRLMAPGRRILVCPKAFSFAKAKRRRGPRFGGCLFVGSGNQFNIEGLTWFLIEVWPIVRRHLPEAELKIAGSIADAIQTPHPGVRWLGRVPDLEPLYDAAQAVIVPLLHATGLNIKLVEAAAHGCPCVATPAALGGAPLLRNFVLEAPDGAAFGQSVVGLLNGTIDGDRLGESSFQFSRTRLSADHCYAQLADYVASAS